MNQIFGWLSTDQCWHVTGMENVKFPGAEELTICEYKVYCKNKTKLYAKYCKQHETQDSILVAAAINMLVAQARTEWLFAVETVDDAPSTSSVMETLNLLAQPEAVEIKVDEHGNSYAVGPFKSGPYTGSLMTDQLDPPLPYRTYENGKAILSVVIGMYEKPWPTVDALSKYKPYAYVWGGDGSLPKIGTCVKVPPNSFSQVSAQAIVVGYGTTHPSPLTSIVEKVA